MVGNLELVLPELEVQDITAKDFFVIHLGLSSLLAPAQRAWHLHSKVLPEVPRRGLEQQPRMLSCVC